MSENIRKEIYKAIKRANDLMPPGKYPDIIVLTRYQKHKLIEYVKVAGASVDPKQDWRTIFGIPFEEYETAYLCRERARKLSEDGKKVVLIVEGETRIVGPETINGIPIEWIPP